MKNARIPVAIFTKGHPTKDRSWNSVAEIKNRRNLLGLRESWEEIGDGFFLRLSGNLKRIVAGGITREKRIKRSLMSEGSPTIATEKDIVQRIQEQLQRGQELARASKLTPEWRSYLEKHGFIGAGARKETF